MNKFYRGYDDITASAAFKQRMVRTLQSETREETPQKTVRLPIRRRTLAILIAAAVLVLAIGTAAAVGISNSTAGQMKEASEERLQQTEDERYQSAREFAEYIVDTTKYDTPIDGSAEVGDLKLSLVSALNDPQDLWIDFTLESETTGVVLTFDRDYLEGEPPAATEILSGYETFCAIGTDACDFRLTYDGTDYTPYYRDDDPNGASIGEHFNYTLMFKTLPNVLPNGAELTLSGTLYRYDRDGNRIGEIGTFSIPFRYEETEEMREARIEEETQKILEHSLENDEYRHDLVANLPDEATRLDAALGDVTITDVAASEEGLLIGVRYRTEGNYLTDRQMLTFFMNGYYVKSDMYGMTEEQQPDGTWMMTVLMRLPYYADREFLTDTLTVGCERSKKESESTKDIDAQGNIYDRVFPPIEEIHFVFRYDLKTGAITLPQNDTERDAWFEKPILATSFDDPIPAFEERGRAINVENVSDEQNGTTVTIRRVQFREDGTVRIIYRADHLAAEGISWETFPEEVLLNGVKAERYREKNMYWEQQDFHVSDEAIQDMLDTYSMERNRRDDNEWELISPMRLDMYDGPITVEIKNWQLFDLNKQGERVLIGTFSFTFTVDPADAFEYNGTAYRD